MNPVNKTPNLKMTHNKNKIITSSYIGYVSQCNCCGKIQFCIGTIMCEINMPTFHRLLASFDQTYKRYKHMQKSICTDHILTFQLAENNVYLRLKVTELDQVVRLFQEAHIELTLQKEIEEILNGK